MTTGNTNISEDFKTNLAKLYQITNCIYWYLEKQQPKDIELCEIVQRIRTTLNTAYGQFFGDFPDSSEPTQALMLADVPRIFKPIAEFMRGGATQRQLEVLMEQYTTDFLTKGQKPPAPFPS